MAKAARSGLLGKNLLPPLQKYKIYKTILGMRNGQLKPGYNVQISTENLQRPPDTRCLIPHLEKIKSQFGNLRNTVIADAGYGGEENYDYLEQNEVEAIAKYSTCHHEKS